MAEAPNQTRREIERTRLRIAAATEELEERIKETTDWQQLVRRYPLISTGIVMIAGFALGSGLLFRPFRRIRMRGFSQDHRSNLLLGLLRPIVTSVLTTRLVDYMRKRSG